MILFHMKHEDPCSPLPGKNPWAFFTTNFINYCKEVYHTNYKLSSKENKKDGW